MLSAATPGSGIRNFTLKQKEGYELIKSAKHYVGTIETKMWVF